MASSASIGLFNFDQRVPVFPYRVMAVLMNSDLSLHQTTTCTYTTIVSDETTDDRLYPRLNIRWNFPRNISYTLI